MSNVSVFTIVNSLRRALRQADEDLLQDCLLEIQNLTTMDDLSEATIIDCNKERIAAAGGIKMICSAMAEHVENIEIQQYGCGTLLNLAKNHQGNQITISHAGGIKIVLAAMGLHATNPVVQEYGCGALMHLARNCDNNQWGNVQAGGIPVIVHAMMSQGTNHEVQQYGCGTLVHLAVNEDNLVSIMVHGFLHSILSALKNEHNREVATIICARLMILASDEGNRGLIVSKSGYTFIVSLMDTYALDTNIQLYCCGALMNMALHGDEIDLNVLDCVICHTLSAMAGNKANVYIQQYGCGTLMNLAIHIQHRDQIVGIGGIGYVIAAIDAQEPRSEAQQFCRVALERLLL